MIVDTSALVAILRGEPEAPVMLEKLLSCPTPRMSAGTLLEARIVAERDGGARELTELLDLAGVDIVPVNDTQVDLAVDGFRRFGKGRHPAGLNFGDCFSYGLAKAMNEELLFKGGDFGQTDIVSA